MMSDKEIKALDSWTAAKIVSSKDQIMNRQKALQHVEKKVAKDKRTIGDEQSQVAVVAPPLKKAVNQNAVVCADAKAVNEEEPHTNEESADCADTGVLNFFGARAL